MDKRHSCKQLQRYQEDTRRGQYHVGVKEAPLEFVLQGNKWYRVEGDSKVQVACCTFCGKRLN